MAESSMGLTGLNAEAPEFCPGSVGPYLRQGFYNEESGWWVPYYIGSLKSFNTRTGYGFVACEQTRDIYKTDIYIHKSQVPMPFTVGAPVEFAVTQNNRGQPQATDVNWLPLTAEQTEESAPKQSGESVERPRRTRHLGTLKSFSRTQGYGFVQCEDLKERHSCDVYLDRGQMPEGNWTIGQAIEFECMYNHRGQPQARNVNWDPVPKLPVAGNGFVPNGAVASNMPQGAGMNLMNMNNKQVTSQQGLRNLNAIQAALHSDKSAAVKLVVDYQEKSDSVDYISFLVDRFGPPQGVVGELAGPAPLQLLRAITQLLPRLHDSSQRVLQLLEWCATLIPVAKRLALKSDSIAADLNDIKEKLQQAQAAPGHSGSEAPAFAAVLAKFSEEVAESKPQEGATDDAPSSTA